METLFKEKRLLIVIRGLVVFYILSLLFWGITTFPIEAELSIVCNLLGIQQGISPDNYEGFRHWIATVNEGVVNTNRAYPFLAYGTDWLAFSHIIIAIAFIGVYAKPVRNVWIVYFGMICCLGVFPLALLCGEMREIPMYWRIIDCSFGVIGFIPLYLLHVYIKRFKRLIRYTPSRY